MSTFARQTVPLQLLRKSLLARFRFALTIAWFTLSLHSLTLNVSAQNPDVVRAVDVVVAPDVENDPQLWLLSSYARVNSALARRACELSEAEEQQLALINDAWIAQQMRAPVNAVAEGVAAGVALFLRGAPVVRNMNRAEQPQQTIERVRHAIDKQVDHALSEDHRQAFRAERAERDKFRSEAAASVLIAVLDERVYLSTEQRQRLEAELAQSAMKELYWQFYFQNQSYMPEFPKDVLNKVLTKEQLEILKGSQTHRFELAQIELQLIQEKPIVIER